MASPGKKQADCGGAIASLAGINLVELVRGDRIVGTQQAGSDSGDHIADRNEPNRLATVVAIAWQEQTQQAGLAMANPARKKQADCGSGDRIASTTEQVGYGSGDRIAGNRTG
ncbi:hypothetical protein [Laspinema olomoucense]|uniref:hypothetical protein n=1 Tax=Laspinema olomoucense TaxID=3231600 RepID=UPI0021BB3F2C|nr:hypothetical protein [Laspinema sp. D3c]MCT7992462.1 hypothetical protein [Laspinema sp. D3c]